MKTHDVALPFHSVWLVDFEFQKNPGENPKPICLVAREFLTGELLRFWMDDLCQLKEPPYPIGKNDLFVAYYAPAEMSCHLALGWALPKNVLDLCVEFKNLTNEREVPSGRGLLGALNYFGIESLDPETKAEMRDLALRGGPWTEIEKIALLDYCESDVVALARLLPKMLPTINLSQAIYRGRYMKTVSEIERIGIPLDVDALGRLYRNWGHIEKSLIAEIDIQHGYFIYDGTAFRSSKFSDWLKSKDLAWPQLPSGGLDLRDETFKEMSRTDPELLPLRQLRASLSQMRQHKLEIGADGRNRTSFWAFSSKTGRNQPSTSKFIFGLSKWFRGFVRPGPGMALAYIDWSQQEFGIAAAFSKDAAMKNAYCSADPYLAFAKQAGAAPENATKESHRDVRKQFKACALGVQYGIGEFGLARKINQSSVHARELLRLHRQTYPRFWTWLDDVLNHAYLRGFLPTVFGWEIHTNGKTRPNTIRNFPMQANGAEMLRLACSLAIDRGVRICAPIHDALLIEATELEIDRAAAITQQAMADASRIILNGFELKSDATIIRYPEIFRDEDGQAMWSRVWRLIDKIEKILPVHSRAPHLFAIGLLPVLDYGTRAIHSLSILWGP